MNRAARRLAGQRGSARSSQHDHVGMVLPLEVAIAMNNDMPVDGLAEVLHEIRAEHGLGVMVGLCGDCRTVEVVQ